MHHRLLVAALVVAKVGVLLERLADAGDVAVAEDAEAAGEEGLLHAVALDVLLLEEGDQRLGHRQAYRCHARFSRHFIARTAADLHSITSGEPKIARQVTSACTIVSLIVHASSAHTVLLNRLSVVSPAAVLLDKRHHLVVAWA